MALRIAARQARLVVFGYNAVTSRISFTRNPVSPQYAGERLDLSGAQVMAWYKDGTVSDITDSCSFDPAGGSYLEHGGDLNITANYTDHAGNQFAADTQIEVADVEELRFTGIQNTPQKEGKPLDLSGAVLSARYTDGTIRPVNASAVVFEPAAGTVIGHTDTLPITATWRNPATGSEYSARYSLTVDTVKSVYFSHGPNKTDYMEGEPLDLTGAVVVLDYKLSGDMEIVTDKCRFYPENGTAMSPYGTSLHAYYSYGGMQAECETLLNVTPSTIPVDLIGELIGGDLGLSFDFDLPEDFWNDFSFDGYIGEIPYIPVDGDFYIPEDAYSSVVDYLNQKGAFAEYQKGDGGQYGDIPFMVLPAGTYASANGSNSIEARADIYIIAAMEKRNGKPETLPAPSCVDYPYTNQYAYNQIQVLTFTLNSSDYIRCSPGLRGGYNSATSGICRKMAGLGLPDVTDETMYTNYETFEDPSIVNIPGILVLPWCWYEELPHDLATLKSIVQNGQKAEGCEGITHTGKVPYLTYSEDSLYDEVKEQFPEVYDTTVTYGGEEYARVRGR